MGGLCYLCKNEDGHVECSFEIGIFTLFVPDEEVLGICDARLNVCNVNAACQGAEEMKLPCLSWKCQFMTKA